MPDLRPCLALLAALATSSCGDGTLISARYAPEFAPGPTTVAFLGVFQGGRLNREAWYPLSARLSPIFGQRSCPSAWAEELQRADAELYGKVEEDVAQNGVSDDLLAQLAPKTDADVVVTLSVHGRVEKARASAVGEDPTLPGGRGSGMGHHRRARGSRTVERRGIELSASLFSVKLGRSVGRISVQYDGHSLEEAMKAFTAKVGAELGGSTCRPWRFSVAPEKAGGAPPEPPKP